MIRKNGLAAMPMRWIAVACVTAPIASGAAKSAPRDKAGKLRAYRACRRALG